jgi:hypothetical protein
MLRDTLTVRQLKMVLNDLKDDSLPILLYIGEAEEYGSLLRITTHNTEAKNSDLPYSKGDSPEGYGNIILLQGDITY